eukprot:5158916-Amphidinium_carterae.1
MPPAAIKAGITAMRVPSAVEGQMREVSPAEATQLGLAYRVARQKFGLSDVDIFEVKPRLALES